MRRMEDKVAFVTGAAGGIGRATALRLAAEGASLYLVDLAPEALEETVGLAEKEGAQVVGARCDVSDEADVKQNVAACVERFGKLDALCNVAGILLLDHFPDIAADQFRRVLEVNLVGPFMLAQAALPHLLETKGSIVNVSSTSALAGMPYGCLLYTSPSPRDKRQSRMPSSA